jgi:hypothetical protein
MTLVMEPGWKSVLALTIAKRFSWCMDVRQRLSHLHEWQELFANIAPKVQFHTR